MKNLPLGIKIISIVAITIGLVYCSVFLVWSIGKQGTSEAMLGFIIVSILFILIGVGILGLREYVRVFLVGILKIILILYFLALVGLAIGIMGGSFMERFVPLILFIILGCVVFIPPIAYLSHPKIKERFK